ncbi:MAG: DegT/DnrJ/EryC1/StrS family aminotransferase [Candidatus Marsarchaeota archaeon]|nr:DegT/DnrJ/EryC1/StrS family aminotransferase [Candidatus Marsarchaeota archaeon]
MNIPLIDLTAQHRSLRNEINAAIAGVFDRADFVLGQDVANFEDEFAAYCGAKYAVGVDSGLSALELSLRALGIGPGDEVIVPAHAFTASAAAITFAGASPVFVDVNPETCNIDPKRAEEAVTPRTKGIIPLHLYGLPADMDTILGIAQKHGLVVVEDACQAHGATFKGRRAGSMGNAAGFSFYPSKNLGGCGDGGMVTTNDDKVAETVRALRNCGQKTKNIHELEPFNHRLDSLQAAILRVKLNYLDDWLASRRSLAELYSNLLAGSNVIVPVEPPGYRHVYYLYVIRSQNRDALQAYLKGRGVGTAIHYPNPVHLQPFYSDGSDQRGKFPVAEKICSEVLSLPLYPELPEEQVGYVVDCIKEFSEENVPLIVA